MPHAGNCRCLKPHPPTEPVVQPTVGRIVHYVGYEANDFCEPRAAIVTAVPQFLPEQPNEGPGGYVKAVHLTVFDPGGSRVMHNVPYSPTPQPGRWSWPPRS